MRAQVNAPIDRQHPPRLQLLCAAMHRCLFCCSWRVMDGLSRGERDPTAATWEMGVSPGAAAALGWVARGDGGALRLHPHRLQFAFICRSLGVPKFALLKERGRCRRLLPKVGMSPLWGSGKLLLNPEPPKAQCDPKSTAPIWSGEQEQATAPNMASSPVPAPPLPSPAPRCRGSPAQSTGTWWPPCPFPPLPRSRQLGVVPMSQLISATSGDALLRVNGETSSLVLTGWARWGWAKGGSLWPLRWECWAAWGCSGHHWWAEAGWGEPGSDPPHHLGLLPLR